MTKLFLSVAVTALALVSAEQTPLCEQPLPREPITSELCIGTFNTPASITLDYPSRSIGNFFVDASYTYWYAGEEGLALAQSNRVLDGVSYYNAAEIVLTQPFQFSSGFEVATGWEKDGWTFLGQYTWVRNTTSQHKMPPAVPAGLGTASWYASPWFLEGSSNGQGLAGVPYTSKWHLGMDIADLMLGYSYYQGRRLVVDAFGGLRAAWIRQSVNLELTPAPGIITLPSSSVLTSHNHSNSWSIGSRMGMEADVLLCCGFRLEGNLFADLLYTKYTKIYHQETAPSSTSTFPTLTVTANGQNGITPVIESGLGLGWGKYLCDNQCHLDISAAYDFMYWWNQNVIRQMLDFAWSTSSSAGDLYLQGLTVTARVDF